MDLNTIFKGSQNKKLDCMFVDENKDVKCRGLDCNWEGKLFECREEEYCSGPSSWRSLAGREGWIFHCPVCDSRVEEFWLRVS